MTSSSLLPLASGASASRSAISTCTSDGSRTLPVSYGRSAPILRSVPASLSKSFHVSRLSSAHPHCEPRISSCSERPSAVSATQKQRVCASREAELRRAGTSGARQCVPASGCHSPAVSLAVPACDHASGGDQGGGVTSAVRRPFPCRDCCTARTPGKHLERDPPGSMARTDGGPPSSSVPHEVPSLRADGRPLEGH